MRLSGRFVAYATMLAMLALSVAGNVAHTYHLNPAPGVRSLVYAVAWPVMVWAGVELFVRVPWRSIFSHRLVRWGGILLPGGIAALVSYRHLRGLLVVDGEEEIVYTFAPLAVDGLMLMATLALLLTRKVQNPEGPKVPRRSLADRVAAVRSSATDTLEALVAPKDAKIKVSPSTTPLVQDIHAPWVQVPKDPEGPARLDLSGSLLDPSEVLSGWVPQVPNGKSRLNGTQVPGDLDAGLTPVVLDVKDPEAPEVPTRTVRGTLDYALVLRRVQEDPNRKDPEIAADLGTSAKTVQRVRRATVLIPFENDAAVQAKTKLPLAAVAIIRQEMNR